MTSASVETTPRTANKMMTYGNRPIRVRMFGCPSSYSPRASRSARRRAATATGLVSAAATPSSTIFAWLGGWYHASVSRCGIAGTDYGMHLTRSSASLPIGSTSRPQYQEYSRHHCHSDQDFKLRHDHGLPRKTHGLCAAQTLVDPGTPQQEHPREDRSAALQLHGTMGGTRWREPGHAGHGQRPVPRGRHR